MQETAEPINMPFWMKTRVGPWNHVLGAIRWDAHPPTGMGNFWCCPGHSKALAIFGAAVTAASLKMGSAGKRVMGSAQHGQSVIYDCLVEHSEHSWSTPEKYLIIVFFMDSAAIQY